MLRFSALLVLLCVASPAASQQYPSRPVRMVIPFTVGSAADIIARAMEPQMKERLGQPVVMDNRGGAGGNIAAEITASTLSSLKRRARDPTTSRSSPPWVLPNSL